MFLTKPSLKKMFHLHCKTTLKELQTCIFTHTHKASQQYLDSKYTFDPCWKSLGSHFVKNFKFYEQNILCHMHFFVELCHFERTAIHI